MLKAIWSWFKPETLEQQFAKELYHHGSTKITKKRNRVIIKTEYDKYYYDPWTKELLKHIHKNPHKMVVKWYYPDGSLKKIENFTCVYRDTYEISNYTRYHPNGTKAFVMNSDKIHEYYTVYTNDGKRLGKWVDDYSLALYFYQLMKSE